MSKITIACAYCGVACTWRQDDIKFSHRAGKITEIQCGTCDSVFEVHLDTKRKRKGKRLREVEAAKAAEIAKALDAARAENKRLGDALLAEPGCTCAERHANSPWSDGGRDDGGHFLSTGWSRDRQLDAMLPTKPRHIHGCPAREAHDKAAS